MIAFLLVILVGGALLYAVVLGGIPKTTPGKAKARGAVKPNQIRPKWDSIMGSSTVGASGLKNAVMEADKLLDHVLKQLGYPGETMAERLKGAQKEFSDRNGVWRAHKLRNVMVHEVGFDLVPSQANEALRDFERGLRDLGAL